jgi:hypothetical protein
MDKKRATKSKLDSEETLAFWKEFIAEAVAQHNIEWLGDMIRKPPACQEVRDYLADVIEGLLSKRISFPNRKPKQDLEERDVALAARVREIQKEKKWKLRSIVDFVAEEKRCSKSLVWAAWSEHGPPIITGEILLERYGREKLLEISLPREIRADWGKPDSGGGAKFGKLTDEEMNLLIKLLNEARNIKKSLRRRSRSK